MDQENLLPFDTPPNNNYMQYFNNEDNNNENTSLSFTQSFYDMIIAQAICFSILITGFILLIIFKPNPLAIISYSIVILGTGFLYVFVLSITTREIQFIKNTYLNQLTIKIKKVCCLASWQYTLMLENAYIYIVKNPAKRV